MRCSPLHSSMLTLTVVLVSACGPGPVDGTHPDAGQPDSGQPADSNQGLYINVALGLTLVQSPVTVGSNPEGAISSSVTVTKDNVMGSQVPATLTINGVEIPQRGVAGVFLGYDFHAVTIPQAVPGALLSLHAAYQTFSADLTLHCPEEVTLTAPADGTQASVGDMVTVSWTGVIEHATFVKPDVMVRSYDPVTGTRSLHLIDRIVTGKSSDTFALPDRQGAPQWLVDLYVPGDLKDGASGIGLCMLDRRVHLVGR